MQNCLVKSNCKSKADCKLCTYYSEYVPIDKRIFSPAQLDAKASQRSKKKVDHAKVEAQKRGRRNKSTGYRSEKYLQEKYEKWGVECKKQPGSGKFKGDLGSDFKVKILGRERLQEDKTRKNLVAHFKRTRDTAIMYGNFCVLMNEQAWHDLLLHGVLPSYITKEDKRIETIKKFFSQDDADVVSIRLPGSRECVFAIRKRLWEEFKNVQSV